MCGICGFVGKVESQGIVLESMMQELYHCEEDDLGEYYWENGAMAFRQDEVVEVKGCHQPRVSDDGRLALVCDGVITNAKMLRKRLEAAGYTFRCGGDKEVILHAYEEYGEEIVNYLEGSYALVIWDRKEERLFAARDAGGGRPLYYALIGGRLAFATSLGSILAFVSFLGKAAMPTGGQEEEQYLPRGIYELAAGQDFRYEQNLLKQQCYCPEEFDQREQDDFENLHVMESQGEEVKKEAPEQKSGIFYYLLQRWKNRAGNRSIRG